MTAILAKLPDHPSEARVAELVEQLKKEISKAMKKKATK